MSALQPVERRAYSEGTSASRREAPATPAFRPPPQAIRPRFGMGPRAGEAKSAGGVDKIALQRTLAISSAVLILGSGLLLSLHLMRPATPAQVATAQVRATPTVHITTVEPAQPRQTTAALAKPATPSPRQDEAAAQKPVTPGAPTAQDLARPAFLEPIENLTEGDDEPAQDAPTPIRAARADATPALAPRPKPRQVAAATSEEVTGSIGKAGRMTSDSFLRAKPSRSGKVLGTLSKGTKVTVYSCKSWCEVASDGKRGYVYRKALKQ